MKKITFILFMFFVVSLSVAQHYGIDKVPQRIILNVTDSPATSIAVTWRTINEYSNSEVKYVIAEDGVSFKEAITSIKPRIEKVQLDNSNYVFHYSAVINNLLPNTTYNYSVGHDSIWSEWAQFKTAKGEEAPFTFVYLGDPQNDLKTFCSRIFREAFKKCPNADFWLFVGDLITSPKYDSLWYEYYYALGFIPTTIPFTMLPGNHEYPATKIGDITKRELTPFWRSHFTLPENGPAGLEETSFYFDYQGTRFIMLNGNEKLNEQSTWMDSILANNPNRWTIVAIHQPLYSTGLERDGEKNRNAFLSLIDKYSVDLVLQGHDHNYGRSYKLYNNQIVKDEEKGTVYVNSVSGSKYYDLNSKHLDLMKIKGEKIQLYQIITIKNDKLEYKSYTVTGKLFDSFELSK